MSKGLEFDTVLICDADSQNYHDEDDKNLLYVACTRALHKLSLFCENEVSPLI
ncbi:MULTISPECIES: ATP-binding domain-containing protein [Lachnospiraceae]|jgi:DNA helicase-2/ATP-dependent DNA helicase PcrA